MKKFFIILLVVIIVAVGGFLSYLKLALPNVGEPEEITIEVTPERVAHGKYLAHSVTVCMDCHSARDWSQFSGPIVPGTEGQGGERFTQEFGFPGTYIAKNITPYGIGDWTDGEILRAISSGVRKNGDALFPIMPHHNYGKMDREDLYSIIAYLKTLPSIEKDHPESESDFPMNFIINTIPKKAEFSTKPSPSDELAYGEYLTTAASCNDCHTKQVKGQFVEGMEFAGGFEFQLPWGMVRSANITQDKETGIGTWTWEQFRDRFKQYQDSAYQSPAMKENDFNSIMPWVMYSSMTEQDLKAIYTYLQTLKPISNSVERFSPN
ncbi:c-type cytochrome [bacterium]|nr:c-type cytochrome [bacterium]